MTEHLTHYGVPGMKWGVRKSKEPSVRSRKAKRIALGVGIAAATAAVIVGRSYTQSRLPIPPTPPAPKQIAAGAKIASRILESNPTDKIPDNFAKVIRDNPLPDFANLQTAQGLSDFWESLK